MFYQILQSLCKQQGVKITNVVSELKISSGNLSKWKAGGVPKGATLKKLADYFHVSTDYLLGREAPASSSELSPEEQELLECYRQLNNDGKKKMNDYLDDLLGNEKNLTVPAASGESAG